MNKNLKKLLSDIWIKEVKDKFLTGTITYERQLQGELYHVMKERVSYPYEIWIEPIIYLEKFNLNKVKPDIVITYDKYIHAVIELKFTPWFYSQYQGDLEKLNRFYKAAQSNAKVVLGWKPLHPNWQIQKEKGKQEYMMNKEMLTVFMVVSRPDSYALMKNEIEKFAPKNLLHFVGWINEDSTVEFKKK